MKIHCEPIRSSIAEIAALGELAEEAGSPWAAWRDAHEVYAIFGGEIEQLDTLGQRVSDGGAEASSRDSERQRLILNSDHAAELSRLAWSLSAQRFQSSSSAQRDHLWPSWGTRGFEWSPQYSLKFSVKTGKGWLGRCGQVREDQSSYERDDGLLGQLLIDLTACHRRGRRQIIAGEANTPIESQDEWSARVEEVIAGCRAGLWNKVVLARALTKRCDPDEIWSGARLWLASCQQSMRHEIPFVISPSPSEQFVGCSPERLFHVRRGLVETHALAGTRVIPERDDLDRSLHLVERELLESQKDIHEHELVVSWIERALEETCHSISVGQRRLKRAGHLLHLETPIVATLNAQISAHDLLLSLHPTPALGGHPQEVALAHIEETERLDRGGYAAPWMWRDALGEATAIVGIRAALLRGHHAYLFAGAGIVAGSTPENEWRETEAKSDVIGHLLNASAVRTQSQLATNAVSLPVRGQARALALIEALQRCGAVGAVISPGSRNTPLALAIDALLPVQISVDERSAAFTALGWAKAQGAPIIVCCTSGSAGTHYLPALTEAFYGGVPLVVLTADRPPRLRGRGAPQTIVQQHLYRHHVKHSVELPEELDSGLAPEVLSALWKWYGIQAIREASRAPYGPVHLNVPFEEPLWDEDSERLLTSVISTSKSSVSHRSDTSHLPRGIREVSEDHALALPSSFDLSIAEGIICCGPLSPAAAHHIAEPLAELSSLTGWPVIAEGSSQLRGLVDTISFLDLLARLQAPNTRAVYSPSLPTPQEVKLILFIGVHTHSRPVRSWISQTQARYFWVGESAEVSDPLALGVTSLGHSCEAFASALRREMTLSASATRSSWRRRWSALEARAQIAHDAIFHRQDGVSGALWGGAIGYDLCACLHQGDLSVDNTTQADLIIASSMAFRDHDLTWRPPHLMRRPHSVWVSRGVNGIDGTFSTALGVALGRSQLDPSNEAPLIVWLGDLAAHHDLQGLHALCHWHHYTSCPRPITIILSNNDGGGIFHHLPISASSRFDRLFVTSIDDAQTYAGRSPWAAIAEWAGARYSLAQTRAEWRDHLWRAQDKAQVTLIEAQLDAAQDQHLHREYWEALCAQVRSRRA